MQCTSVKKAPQRFLTTPSFKVSQKAHRLSKAGHVVSKGEESKGNAAMHRRCTSPWPWSMSAMSGPASESLFLKFLCHHVQQGRSGTAVPRFLGAVHCAEKAIEQVQERTSCRRTRRRHMSANPICNRNAALLRLSLQVLVKSVRQFDTSAHSQPPWRHDSQGKNSPLAAHFQISAKLPQTLVQLMMPRKQAS